jgi:transposase
MVGQREFMDVHDAWVRGKSISEIARQTGRDRKTIRRLLREGHRAGRKPRQISSKLDPFREYLLARMVGEDPVSNAEVLYDEIRELGYRGGRSILIEFMHPFRTLAKEKATARFESPPGRQAQVDWGTFKKPGRKRVQGLVMTLGWSRAQYPDFTDSQALALFLGCHEQAFHYLGGVPEEIFYDRVKTVWLHDDEHGDPVFHPGFVDFAEHYAAFDLGSVAPIDRRPKARPRTESATCAGLQEDQGASPFRWRFCPGRPRARCQALAANASQPARSRHT